MGDSESKTLARARNTSSGLTINKCYYKTVFGEAQGDDASSMSKETLVDNDHLGSGWEISGDNVVPKMKDSDIINPVFNNVTIVKTENPVNFTGGTFKGNYAPLEITDANRDNILLLAGGNKLGYAKTDRTVANGKALGCFRAYFNIPTASPVRNYELNFGEDGGTTGVKPLTFSPEWERTAFPREGLDGVWYDLNGRRVTNPTKGVYIYNGKKIVK